MYELLYKIGDKIGKWEVIEDAIREKAGYVYRVKCECGRTARKIQSVLKHDYTKSCKSCALKQTQINNGKNNLKLY